MMRMILYSDPRSSSSLTILLFIPIKVIICICKLDIYLIECTQINQILFYLEIQRSSHSWICPSGEILLCFVVVVEFEYLNVFHKLYMYINISIYFILHQVSWQYIVPIILGMKFIKELFWLKNVFNKCRMYNDKSNSKLFLVYFILKTRRPLAHWYKICVRSLFITIIRFDGNRRSRRLTLSMANPS